METNQLTVEEIELMPIWKLFLEAKKHDIVADSAWDLKQQLIVKVMKQNGSIIDLSEYTETVTLEKEATIKEDEKRRRKLEIYLEEIKKIYATIMSFEKIKDHLKGEITIIERDDPLISFINNEMKTVAEDFEKMAETVQKKPNCSLLICGDSGAGKSSFINLLLRYTLLPTSILSNSSCQVRITYGEPVRAEIIDNDSKLHIIYESEFAEKLSAFLENIDDRRKVSCKSATIFLTSTVLQGGLDIYDTIGLGETEMFNNELKKELNQITGIIFLLKKNSPIGDKTIGGLSEIIQQLAEQGLPWGSMKFIINMCDQLRDNRERDSLRENVIDQLRDKCNLSNAEVRTFSTKQELDFQKNDVMTKNYKDIIQLINQLHISSINTNTVKVFSFIMKFVQQTIDQINELEKYSDSDKANRKDYILRLRHLENDRKLINQRFSAENRKYLVEERKACKKKVEDHFRQRETREEVVQEVLNRQSELYGMTKIDEIDLKIQEISHEEISKSFKKFIETNGILKNCCDKMLNTFMQQFAEHQKKKESIHKTMNRHIDVVMGFIEGDFKEIIKSQGQNKGFLHLISPILVPIIMIKANIIKATWFSYISAVFNKVNIHTFYDDTSTYVSRQASAKYSSYFYRSSNITELIKCLFKAPEKVTNDFEKFISDDMDYLAKNIQSLNDDMRQKDIVFGTYKEIKGKLQEILEEICQFSLLRLHKERRHIMNENIRFLPLTENNNDKIKPIIKGRNRLVFRGQIDCEFPHDSCIMVFKDKDNKTWRQIYEEYKKHNDISGIRLRNDSANVSQCFLDLQRHVIFNMDNNDDIRPTFLVNGIDSSLRKYVHELRDNLYLTPEDAEERLFNEICKLLQQILQGLEYLHSRSLVHYDLTGESIGYSSYGLVKLTSVSLPTNVKVNYEKSSQNYVMKMAHLPLGILDPAADTLYDSGSDMYCLGILIYSMWLGDLHPFFHAINDNDIMTITDFVQLIKKNEIEKLLLKNLLQHSFAEIINIWFRQCRDGVLTPTQFLEEIKIPKFYGIRKY